MASLLLQALKASTAHGISHAVATRSVALRVMYLIAFLVFCGLFINYTLTLLAKLRSSNWTRDIEYNAEKFEFPDLYFCPTHAVSGSYPYNLSRQDAEEINREVLKAGDLYEDFVSEVNGSAGEVYFKLGIVLRSIPSHIISDRISQRAEQSVLRADLIKGSISQTKLSENFYHPSSTVCFKPVLSESDRIQLQSPDSSLELWLLADSFFSDQFLLLTGHPVHPVKAKGSNLMIPLRSWNPNSWNEIPVTGFRMLVVPRNKYPSQSYETSLLLNPGRAYEVKLKMDTFKFDEKLVHEQCDTHTKKVTFANPIDKSPQEFEYSLAACYHAEKNRLMIERLGCLDGNQPVVWQYRHYSRCFNLSEIPIKRDFDLILSDYETWAQADVEARRICSRKHAPEFQRYRMQYSFASWPNEVRSAIDYFASWSQLYEVSDLPPAHTRLVLLSQELSYFTNETQLERELSDYLSKNLLQVKLQSAEATSKKIQLVPAYTIVQFLADAGGLLGLYIGCSLLTLLEVVELVHNVTCALRDTRLAAARAAAEARDAEDGKGREADDLMMPEVVADAPAGDA